MLIFSNLFWQRNNMKRKVLFLLFLKNKKNMQVRSQLIGLHYPLVHKIVQKFNYYPRVLTKEDLFQEGLLGLMKALDYYQDLGYDFLAYARPHIQKAISETIRKINGYYGRLIDKIDQVIDK
ncbi:MAG: sigma-70 family RNA polymerase sigma factor [Candidatus Phytoplasma australasiaticum]|nr:sigma-70 family RNA polymerase sigma factor [Candidatus Phytoplasma australasiaticum]